MTAHAHWLGCTPPMDNGTGIRERYGKLTHGALVSMWLAENSTR
jgi:hypothetical protein